MAKTKVAETKSEARGSYKVVDWSKANRVCLPNLKPSTRRISLRLPVHTLERIKAAANARDVPYQSLIKVWLEEKLTWPIEIYSEKRVREFDEAEAELGNVLRRQKKTAR